MYAMMTILAPATVVVASLLVLVLLLLIRFQRIPNGSHGHHEQSKVRGRQVRLLWVLLLLFHPQQGH
jgi:hypothetical protein